MNEIRRVTIAESADIAAKRATETMTVEPNPHQLGTADYLEWHRHYCIAVLKWSTLHYRQEHSQPAVLSCGSLDGLAAEAAKILTA